MMELFFGGNAVLFGVPAMLGSAVFLLRIGLMLIGGHSGGDFHGADIHADVVHGGDAHSDSGQAFKTLSIQSVSAFLLGFGWVGLGAYRGSGLSLWTSVGIALAAGFALMWLLGLALKAMNDLQASGTIDIHTAIGQEGDVYCTVPPRGKGRGQVRVIVQERQRIYNAVTDGESLPTSSRIRVMGVNEDNTLTVCSA
jgi:hypothetical protein